MMRRDPLLAAALLALGYAGLLGASPSSQMRGQPASRIRQFRTRAAGIITAQPVECAFAAAESAQRLRSGDSPAVAAIEFVPIAPNQAGELPVLLAPDSPPRPANLIRPVRGPPLSF